MANSSHATVLEVGGLTAGEITYSVLKEYSIEKKQQLKQMRRDKNLER